MSELSKIKRKHTPLPYEYTGDRVEAANGKTVGYFTNIGSKSSAQMDADAAFVILACNSYYACLEALKKMRHYYEADGSECLDIDAVNKAIAAATPPKEKI